MKLEIKKKDMEVISRVLHDYKDKVVKGDAIHIPASVKGYTINIL